MSKSHAMIAFENTFDHFDVDKLIKHKSLAAVNNAKERNSVFKKCISTTYGYIWILHSMAYALVLQKRLSVTIRSDASLTG